LHSNPVLTFTGSFFSYIYKIIRFLRKKKDTPCPPLGRARGRLKRGEAVQFLFYLVSHLDKNKDSLAQVGLAQEAGRLELSTATLRVCFAGEGGERVVIIYVARVTLIPLRSKQCSLLVPP
jgi:hypothetical protein